MKNKNLTIIEPAVRKTITWARSGQWELTPYDRELIINAIARKMFKEEQLKKLKRPPGFYEKIGKKGGRNNKGVSRLGHPAWNKGLKWKRSTGEVINSYFVDDLLFPKYNRRS